MSQKIQIERGGEMALIRHCSNGKVIWSYAKYIANTLAVLSLHMLCSSALANGPFGIVMGSNINELGCQQLSANNYKCTAVPNPHPSFKAYYVKYEVGAGICRVLGVGSDIESSDYGSQIKQEADKIARQLDEQYGQSQKEDFLVSGSRLDSPKGWMMSIDRKERFYAYIWEKPDSDKNINKIVLEAHASGRNVGNINVLFEFSNYGACMRAKLDGPSDVRPAPGDGLRLGYDLLAPRARLTVGGVPARLHRVLLNRLGQANAIDCGCCYLDAAIISEKGGERTGPNPTDRDRAGQQAPPSL